jgi:uncharacterized membrane protein HdeD (DUF308 family)
MKLLKYKWLLALKGAILILMGLLTFVFPGTAYLGLVVYFSVALLATGIALLGFAVANRRVLEGWGWQFTEGCLDALVGFILLAHPAITIVTLPVVIGLWAIFNGLLTLSGIWSMCRRGFVQWIWVAMGGAFTLLFGFITLFSPVTGMLALVLLTALTFVGAGISSLITAYRLSRPGKATGLTLGRSVPGSVSSSF